MSETIKSVFINYIVCAIAGGFLEYFAPPKSRKTLRVIIMGVILATSFAPLLKTEITIPDFSGYDELSENASYDALMHTANLTEKKIYNEMKQILINQQVSEYEIYVRTSVEKDENTVYLDEVKIEIPEEFNDKIPAITEAVPVEYKSVFTIEQINAG